jgi:hypothetical protein
MVCKFVSFTLEIVFDGLDKNLKFYFAFTQFPEFLFICSVCVNKSIVCHSEQSKGLSLQQFYSV